MTARARFLFDADFGVVKETPRRTITPEEHEAAVAAAEQRGYARGLSAAEVQARTEAQRRTAAASERMAAALMSLAGEMKAIRVRLLAEAAEVAVATARKLAPALIAREPFAEIAALASDCVGSLMAAPHVVVRVNNELYAEARERLEDIARSRGYEGRLVVLGETDIRLGDCRIEWADGGVVRDRAALEATIDGLVSRYVASCQAR
jgi:flagellar assembly protein FliH